MPERRPSSKRRSNKPAELSRSPRAIGRYACYAESSTQALLLIEWDSVADHMDGFRQSAVYRSWSAPRPRLPFSRRHLGLMERIEDREHLFLSSLTFLPGLAVCGYGLVEAHHVVLG